MRKDLNLDIDLTLEPRYTKEFVVKKQDSINLCISLKNNNIPVPVEGQVPRLYVRKQDGSVVVQGGTEELGDGSIYLVENTVIIKLKNSAVNATGLCYAELELEDESGITITQSFLFEVIDRLVDTDTPIKAVDDIYLLAEVEKFIIQAKKDLKELRELIEKLDADIKEAVEYFNTKIVEVDTAINQRLNDAKAEIDTVKENTKTEIDAVKTETIETITNIKNESLEEINTKKEEIIDTMETLQGEVIIKVDEVSENHLRALETARDTHLEELEAKSLEKQEKIVAKGDEKVSEIVSKGNEKVSEIEITANNKLNELREADETLNETIRISNIAGNNLEAIRQSAIEIKNQLDTSKEEGQTVANLLNNLMDNCEAMRKALQIENDEAVLNMEELRPLNGEADIRIIELRDLIQQAIDIAIPALKAYIEEHKPAEDLTEVNVQLEELYNAVRELDVRFNNYYTKSEINELLKDKVGIVEDEAVQTIFADIPDFITSPPPKINFEPVNTLFYSRLANQQHILCYFKKEIKNNIVLDANNYIYFNNLADNDVVIYYWDTRYSEGWKGSDRISNVTGNGSSSYRITNFYYHDFDIYSKNDTTKIVRKNIEHDASNDVNDFNNATTLGKYKVSQTANVLNSPLSGTFKAMLIVDKIDAVDAIISQELIIEGNTSYKRLFINNAWTEWKEGGGQEIDLTPYTTTEHLEENYYDKNAVDKKISSIDIDTYKGEIGYSEYKVKPEGFDEAFKRLLENPKAIYPNMKGNVVGYIQGTISRQTDTNSSGKRVPGVILFTDYNNIYNKLRPTIIKTSTNNGGFDIVQLKTASGGEIGSSNRSNMSYPCIIDNKTGEFIEGYMPNSNYDYTITDYYYSTVDIYNTDGAVAYPACQGELPIKYNDCNDAIEEGNYKINIKEGEVVENTPYEGAIEGILKVNKAKNIIHQKLINNNDEAFTRISINNIWTEWQKGGASDIDLSSYYNKQETDNKIDEKISAIQIPEIPEIDLSNYYNKAEIDAKLVKEIGIIKSGDPNFREPVWDTLPENTFVNIPVNPDPSTYKWEMKCSHYNYHMVFYFPIDPTGKFGIVKRSDGKLGFKLLDNSFKYTTYTSYYKAKDSTKKWSAMPSDNHFTNPTKRELEAIYSHNFDIVDGDNPDKIFRYGSQNDFDAEPVKDFNDATEYEVYTVDATESGIIENSPMTGTYKGVLEVVKANGFIEQTLKDINSDTSYFRRFDKTSWSEWRPNTIIEYGEHIIEAPATLEEDEELDLLSITRGTIKDNDKYYARIAPTKRFTKVTGVTLASDLADLIIGFELNLNAVLINNSKDFMLFMKNNFKTDDSGYKGYEGLNMLMGRKIKYTIIGY